MESEALSPPSLVTGRIWRERASIWLECCASGWRRKKKEEEDETVVIRGAQRLDIILKWWILARLPN